MTETNVIDTLLRDFKRWGKVMNPYKAGPENNSPPEERRPSVSVLDQRFHQLLGSQRWRRLPAAIRRRFSQRVQADESIIYRGKVLETRLSRVGWLFAHLLQLIGGPLPLENQTNAPSVVTVTEGRHGSGQWWSRQYARGSGPPQVIQSIKRFSGSTGLEEMIGAGFGMALLLEAHSDRLVFKSQHFFLKFRSHRFRLPDWLLPLNVTVTHRQSTGQSFFFELLVQHSFLGDLIRQSAVYHDS